jgi:hypothetical protein
VVAGRNGNGAPEVAMLLKDAATGETAVRVADAATNARQAVVRDYSTKFTPIKRVAVSDLTGNGIEEFAVLGRNPDTSQVTAEIREGPQLRAGLADLVQQGLHALGHGHHRRLQRQRRRGADDAGALRDQGTAPCLRERREDRDLPETAEFLKHCCFCVTQTGDMLRDQQRRPRRDGDFGCPTGLSAPMPPQDSS